jgi:hypothetical protein
MMLLRRILVIALVAAFAAGPAFASYMSAAGFRPDQPNLRWKGSQIRVSLSDSLTQPSFNIKAESDVLGAVLRSFKAWEDVANIEFITETSDKQGISPSGPVGDGVSLITIGQTPENVLLFSKDPDRESAKTRVFYNSKGFITEADIVLNPFQMFSTDGSFGTFDLQATLTHEIGHLLGLRHSGVLGAAMAESISKNGTFGIPDLSARNLAMNDIAAVREIYDSPTADETTCCGTVQGRITGPAGRPLKTFVRVWAEEIGSGRVSAQTETTADGSYRLGGLEPAAYTLYWQTRDEDQNVSSGEIGTVEVDKGEPVQINGKVTRRSVGPEIAFVGLNSRLANTAVPLKPGRSHMVYLGGRGLDPSKVSVEFNSPHIRLASSAYARPDFGSESSVISFLISIDDAAPSGLYSIFVIDEDGSRSSMIGALKVD